MSKGFETTLALNASQFIAGAGKVTDQLESIRDGLGQLGDGGSADAEKAADAVADLGDAAGEAEREISKSADAMADSFDDVPGAARDAGKDVERAAEGMTDALENVSDTAKDVKFDALGDDAKDAARDVERATDDIRDEIEKVGDTADDAGKEIGKGLDEGADAGKRSFDDLRKATIKQLEKIGDSAKDTGRKVGRELDDGTERAAEGFDELKDEAGQSGREAAASFSGEFDDVADLIQELAANAFIGFGPAGMLAGMAAAAGIGTVVKALENSREEAERTQEQFEAMVDALTSGDPEEITSLIDENIKNIAKSADDAVMKLEEFERLMEALEGTGMEAETVLRALGGDSGAIAEISAQLDPLIEKEKRAAAAAELSGMAYQGNLPVLLDLRKKLEGSTKATADAEKAADTYESATRKASDAVEAAASVQKSFVDLLNDEIEARAELAESHRTYAQVLADQDDALATATDAIAKNNDAITDSNQLVIENKAVLADLADELINEADAAKEAGIEGEELSRIKRENYDDFVRTAEAAGLEADEIRQLADDFGLLPDKVDVPISTPGYGTAVTNLRTFDSEARGIPASVGVGVDFRVPDLQRLVNIAAARVRANVAVNVYTNIMKNWWG